tara:strand:+ start:164 stop:406 length:243 start_codon:yes stop_codon:yes gene_type:complete
MEYTDENIDKVAQKIVNDMDLDSIMAYVYDDLCGTMWKDDAHFIELLERYGISEEDFVDSKKLSEEEESQMRGEHHQKYQ